MVTEAMNDTFMNNNDSNNAIHTNSNPQTPIQKNIITNQISNSVQTQSPNHAIITDTTQQQQQQHMQTPGQHESLNQNPQLNDVMKHQLKNNHQNNQNNQSIQQSESENQNQNYNSLLSSLDVIKSPKTKDGREAFLRRKNTFY